jgi:hypothetical protein
LQNYEGFWEYRVLGYVTLLDGYVSKHFSKFNPPTTPPKKKKLEQLENRLAEMSPPLNPEQQSAVVAAVTGIFSAKNMSFANKFSQLLDSLDKNVVKIINLTDDDFKTIKDLRNDIAHGDELTFKGPDFTPILVITSKITLLLTYLFFLDIGLAPDDFTRCLSRGHNRLRMAANVDNVHLDRVVHPTHFFQVSSSVLASIRQRSTRLIYSCFVRDHSGDIAYSNSRSVDCEIRAARNGQVSQIHELLDLPKEAVAFYQKAYFEDGTQTEAVDLAIFINMDSN